MEKKPRVSVVIASWNAKEDLTRCIRSAFDTRYARLEVVVVDNASTDGTVAHLNRVFGKKIRVIPLKENRFAGGARDLGWRKSRGEAVFFLDQDNVIDRNCISELVRVLFSDPAVGEVGPKMYWGAAPDTLWFAGVRTSLWTSMSAYVGSNQRDRGQFDRVRETDHIPNAFMLRRSVLEQVGGFDLFYKMEFEESDLAMKVRAAGYRVLVVPSALDWHHTPMLGSKSERSKAGSTFSPRRVWLKARNRVRFMKKHASPLQFGVFALVFVPFLAVLYAAIFLREGRVSCVFAHWRGLLAGFFAPVAGVAGR